MQGMEARLTEPDTMEQEEGEEAAGRAYKVVSYSFGVGGWGRTALRGRPSVGTTWLGVTLALWGSEVVGEALKGCSGRMGYR